jgi:hypothetical protein
MIPLQEQEPLSPISFTVRKKSHRFAIRIKAIVIAFGLCLLGRSEITRAVDLGGGIGKGTKLMQNTKDSANAAVAGVVPSGAVTYLGEVDRALERMDRMMSDKAVGSNKADRIKSVEAALQEARDKMQIVESRYAAKMGKEHAELVSRRQRIATGVKTVEAFKVAMGDAIQKEEEARQSKGKQEPMQQVPPKDAKGAGPRQTDPQGSPTSEMGAGKIVFSKSPIDPAKPANLTTSFKAGDTIYGLIQAGKSWREIYGAKGKTELGLMTVMVIGENQTLQYITLKKGAYIDSAQLVLDIAPAPELMTAYKDPDILFGEGKGNRKIGPIAFTYELGQLPAGKHKIQFFIRNYGDNVASGELEIEGSDFKFYAQLHEKFKAASESMATLPPAQMVNHELEGQMRKLLQNAGWNNILRLVIVDKDWWLEGSTSRYLNVAAAAKGADGKCYWCNLQFTQPRLITGAWGALELTKTGIKRNIAEENVNK